MAITTAPSTTAPAVTWDVDDGIATGATPGITVLPHFGGLHPTRDELVAALFVENLRRFLDGEPLRHAVDPARGY